MASTNNTLNHLGVFNANLTPTVTESRENFEVKLSAEIMVAYNYKLKLIPLFRSMQLEKGSKGNRFSFSGRMAGKYHNKGVPITDGGQSNVAHKTIETDELFYSTEFIDNLDAFMSSPAAREDNVNQMAYALALHGDEQIAIMAIKAARSANALTGEVGGTILNNTAAHTDATILLNLFRSANSVLDANRVDDEGRFGLIQPAQYSLMAADQDIQNTNWGGGAGWVQGTLGKIDSIELIKTRSLPSTVIAQDATHEFNDYAGDFTKTVAGVFTKQAAATVTAKGVTTQMTDPKGDHNIINQGDRVVVAQATGAGFLRTEHAVEISKAA